MKWPNSLTFIRHGESAYNQLKKQKQDDPEYAHFKDVFERDFAIAEDERWPSDELKTLAREVWQKTRLTMSDYNTPLTGVGAEQAIQTGKELSKLIALPDIIYVSPYLRTRQTLQGITEGWPALASVWIVPEERIREQEHGVGTVFNDWRIYFTFNPLQGLLYKLEGDYGYRHLNGESKADVRDRVRSFLATLIREDSGRNVLMISHHLTLLSLRANLERWDREQFIEVDEIEKPINCGVTIYKGNPNKGRGGWLELETYNKKLY